MNYLKSFVVHWKTSSLGVIGGILIAASSQPDWKHAALAIATALLGLFAKDLDK